MEHSAAPFLPRRRTLPALRAAAAACKGCPLWRLGTQTVFGEGSPASRVVLVGEQPGDKEDLAGRPFVGPAGALLDRSLEEAGIDRKLAYVTNAVKHFKWEARGKRRIHKKPGSLELRACRPWLEAELELLEPAVLVLLGATAAQSVLGPKFRVSVDRGKVLSSPLAAKVVATVHPSSILRAPDEETRRVERARFVADLRAAAALLART